MSISFAPFVILFKTMSMRQYVPLRPAPSLYGKINTMLYQKRLIIYGEMEAIFYFI